MKGIVWRGNGGGMIKFKSCDDMELVDWIGLDWIGLDWGVCSGREKGWCTREGYCDRSEDEWMS